MQKYVNLVDLVKSFPTRIYLQKSASIQPRTSLSKFGGKFNSLFIRLLSSDYKGFGHFGTEYLNHSMASCSCWSPWGRAIHSAKICFNMTFAHCTATRPINWLDISLISWLCNLMTGACAFGGAVRAPIILYGTSCDMPASLAEYCTVDTNVI